VLRHEPRFFMISPEDANGNRANENKSAAVFPFGLTTKDFGHQMLLLMLHNDLLLDLARNLTQPSLCTFRFVTVKLNLSFQVSDPGWVKLNLSFQLCDPRLQLRGFLLRSPKLVRHFLGDPNGVSAVSLSQFGRSPQQSQNIPASDPILSFVRGFYI
jgi:hypothetical protein